MGFLSPLVSFSLDICIVVGGVVTMFAFLNNCMTTSTQRFMTFELGKGNLQKLK